MGPVICVITPPRPAGAASMRELLDRIGAAARAGVHLVQIRQPDWNGGALAALTEHSVVAVRGTRARVLVNDRLDAALAAGAHGGHLPGGSMPASRVRAAAPPGFLIGRSVHAAGEAVAAARDGGVDYLILGTVFATASKPDAATAGTSGLTGVCAAVPVPVLAVGGITLERLGGVAAAGAAGFAAVRLFAEGRVDELQTIVERAVLAFDTSAGVP